MLPFLLVPYRKSFQTNERYCQELVELIVQLENLSHPDFIKYFILSIKIRLYLYLLQIPPVSDFSYSTRLFTQIFLLCYPFDSLWTFILGILRCWLSYNIRFLNIHTCDYSLCCSSNIFKSFQQLEEFLNHFCKWMPHYRLGRPVSILY